LAVDHISCAGIAAISSATDWFTKLGMNHPA